MNKFYAIRNEESQAIFFSEETLHEYRPTFAHPEIKFFDDYNEAVAFCLEVKTTPKVGNTIPEIDNTPETTDHAVAYVDGSFDKEKCVVGAGVVFCHNGEEVELTKATNNKVFTDYWNVAGELKASVVAIKHAISLGLDKIEICHDYQGVSAWANGQWRAKNILTQSYVEFITEKRAEIEIVFTKVKAHSGVRLNEKADQLAKKAILEF